MSESITTKPAQAPVVAATMPEAKKQWVYPEIETIPIEATQSGFDGGDDCCGGYS